MVVYAGFTYRRPYVEEAARACLAAARAKGIDTAHASHFEPSMLPPGGVVDDFAAPVDYCFARASAATAELARVGVTTRTSPCFTRRGTG